LTSRRGAQRCAWDVKPIDDATRIEPEVVEFSQGQCGEPVAAAFVTWEGGFVNHDNRPAGSAQFDCGGAASGATANDHDVNGESLLGHQ
jgi:hypothetical protein